MRRLWRALPLLLVALSVASLVLNPKPARTVPLYATRTGLMCQSCHFDPNGGGPRNEFGFNYAKNRHSLSADTTSEFKDLNLVNRVSDNFPLYFGLNQRVMLIGNQLVKTSGLDRDGFFNMETAIYATFQPHPKLTLVYDLEDGPFSGFQVKDAYGMIGLGSEHYLRVGQFRIPFGLRMDDHTVATRNSFLDFESGQSFLPYNSRGDDRGFELGGTHGNWFGRASWTNGLSINGNLPPNVNQHAQALAAKLGFNSSAYQGGISIYDDDFNVPGLGYNRATRWGTYGLTHAGPIMFLGELAAGTDASPVPSEAPVKRNTIAGWAEADWAPGRTTNFRVRYDHLDLDRATNQVERDLNTYHRYSVEGEWVPVPFAELRWAFRLIDPVAAKSPGGATIPNEKQGFLQVHFSY